MQNSLTVSKKKEKAIEYWANRTEWATYPHVVRFDSLAELTGYFAPREDFEKEAERLDFFVKTSRAMRRFSQRLLVQKAALWRENLKRILKVPLGERGAVAPSTTTTKKSGSIYCGDLSTHRPCGGSPPRHESPHMKAFFFSN